MTAKQIIDRVDEVKPNAFSGAAKLEWLNELEGRVAAEVMLMPQAQIRELKLNPEDTPLVEPPYDSIYTRWLEAMIDEENGEYDRYAATAGLFNAAWSEFTGWFARTYDPAQGYRKDRRRRYGTI